MFGTSDETIQSRCIVCPLGSMSAIELRDQRDGPLNLKLLTDFFNKIGPSPPFTIFIALTR
jgi:hypothetical protein